ncbi:unnamed protein product [Cuscuta epithymum]|uniref:Uncharacterized protein n=1 Tax=Cuscuta epithymum TaxID=186058 RepID=A0AAV0E0W3_9ASTE|nr:unnamed protein product [Cuscuta epithymum]CAH9144153.1 unnamed protein product [Cuscuta epithymum]
MKDRLLVGHGTKKINSNSSAFMAVNIESKAFKFELTPSYLCITQIKDNHCRSISLDEEGIIWLCNAFLQIQSEASWAFTRYENSRKIHLTFEENHFGGFMRLVDMNNEGRTTIIIPEGWKGDGFKRFSEALFDQQNKMRALKMRHLKIPLEDLGISNSMEYRFDSVDSSLESSISSLLFNEDLKHLMGTIGVIGKGVGESSNEAIVESNGKSEQDIRNEGAVIDYIPLQESIQGSFDTTTEGNDGVLDITPIQVSLPSQDIAPSIEGGFESSEPHELGDDHDDTPICRLLTDRELLDRLLEPEIPFTGFQVFPRRSARIKEKRNQQ